MKIIQERERVELGDGSSYLQPRIGLCDCGEEVYLENFTNT